MKRLIGEDFEDVEDESKRLAYTVTADEDGFAVLACPNSEGGEIDVQSFPMNPGGTVRTDLCIADATMNNNALLLCTPPPPSCLSLTFASC